MMKNIHRGVSIVLIGILSVMYGYQILTWYSYAVYSAYLTIAGFVDIQLSAGILIVLFVGIEVFESKYKIFTYILKMLMMCIVYVSFLKIGFVDILGLSEANKVLLSGAISIPLALMIIIIRSMSIISNFKRIERELTHS